MLTQSELHDALRRRTTEAPLSASSIATWELGLARPRSQDVVWALEELLGAEPGVLTAPLLMPTRPHGKKGRRAG